MVVEKGTNAWVADLINDNKIIAYKADIVYELIMGEDINSPSMKYCGGRLRSDNELFFDRIGCTVKTYRREIRKTEAKLAALKDNLNNFMEVEKW